MSIAMDKYIILKGYCNHLTGDFRMNVPLPKNTAALENKDKANICIFCFPRSIGLLLTTELQKDFPFVLLVNIPIWLPRMTIII